ncbi:MAG: nucleoside recognition protein [Desulfobacula sp.]|nr:nucleoside recognition protein [Desulfobacula sp.]
MKPGKKINYKALLFSISLTLGCLFLNQVLGKAIDGPAGFENLGFPLIRLLFFISIGLLAGQLIENMGWTRQVAVIARPFFNFSHLGNRCSAAFTSAFISGVTANAMLLDYYEDGRISKTQLFLSNYVNQFPAFFLHLPTTLFIILPLTGIAGMLYLALTFFATLLRTVCFLVFGRLFLPQHPDKNKIQQAKDRAAKPDFRDIIKKIQLKMPTRVINIVIWVLPIYTIVFLLNMNGFFTYLNKAMAQTITLSIIPVESLSVVILSFAAEFTSGFAAAGALMDAGVLSVKQTVMALLLGNILAFPIRALRHQLPRYMGIFSPKMGLQLLLSGQLFRVLSIILVGTLYYMVA